MEPDINRNREDLAIELYELKEREQLPYLSEARKETIRRRMAVILFELRYPESA